MTRKETSPASTMNAKPISAHARSHDVDITINAAGEVTVGCLSPEMAFLVECLSDEDADALLRAHADACADCASAMAS